MIDPELAVRLDALEAKVDAAFRAAEAARKHLFWGSVVTVVLFVLPLIGLAIAIPKFLTDYAIELKSLGL